MSSHKDRMPDFLILGATKAGTTSLAACLDQHPNIFMSPIKESGFFAFEGQAVEFRGPGDELIPKSSKASCGDYFLLTWSAASPTPHDCGISEDL